MKAMKKLLCLALVLTMVLCLGVAALADTTYTITMNTSDGHTYTAYQIFKGDLSTDGTTLSNVQWGDNIDGDALLTALKADATYGVAFADCTTAASVAKVIGNYSSNGDDIEAIAKIIAGKTTGTGTASQVVSVGEGESAKDTIVMSGLAAGYYLVVDSTAEASMPEGDTYSKFILQVVKDIAIAAKDSTTSSDKQVCDTNNSTQGPESAAGADPTDTADMDIGDKVKFVISTTIAGDFEEYETYYLAFHDEMDPGLKLDSISSVYVINSSGPQYVSTWYPTISAAEDGHSFDVIFTDLKKLATTYGLTAGSRIDITFYAELTEDAVIGEPGNQNKMYVEYSNNPNSTQHGKTPEDIVTVFTFRLDVNKVDNENKPLDGAGFTLYKWQNVRYKDEDGHWQTKKDWDDVSGEVLVTAVKDADNNVVSYTASFPGLDDGYYKLVETTTPDSFNTCDDIFFEVVATHAEDADGKAAHITDLAIYELTDNGDGTFTRGDARSDFTLSAPTGTFSTTIVNQPGSVLPSTGGIGTTIFYVIGSILVIGAGAVLVARRRTDKEC